MDPGSFSHEKIPCTSLKRVFIDGRVVYKRCVESSTISIQCSSKFTFVRLQGQVACKFRLTPPITAGEIFSISSEFELNQLQVC
jgi:hypothetical protein